MDLGTITLIKDYGGLVIGLVFLLAAVSVLPGRIKYYVLTAGLAVIGYEFWMRNRNRKLLAEADVERKKLRSRVLELNLKGAELEKTVSEMNAELDQLNAKKLELSLEGAKLAEQGAEVEADRLANEVSARQVVNETNNLLEQLKGRQSALDYLQDANLAYADIGRMGTAKKE